MSIFSEVRELHELNIDLMETLLVIGQRLIEYADKNQIHLGGLESLELLVARAERLVEEIGTPYRKNPIQGTWKEVNRKGWGVVQFFGGGGLVLLVSW